VSRLASEEVCRADKPMTWEHGAPIPESAYFRGRTVEDSDAKNLLLGGDES
jgi:hypothetical protein